MEAIIQKKESLPFVVCVEGNIGSGKSTLLSSLASQGYSVIPEPVLDIWGQYLPRLYEDINRWGFCFQMEVIDWFRQLQSKKFQVCLSNEIKSNIMLSPKLMKNLRRRPLQNCTADSNHNNRNNAPQQQQKGRKKRKSLLEQEFDACAYDCCTTDAEADAAAAAIDENSCLDDSDAVMRSSTLSHLTPPPLKKKKLTMNNNNNNNNKENNANFKSNTTTDGMIENILDYHTQKHTADEIANNLSAHQRTPVVVNNVMVGKSAQEQKRIDNVDLNIKRQALLSSQSVVIVERSALSAIEVFGLNLLQNGNITEWEYSLLQRFYSMIRWQPKYIFYLRCDPKTCCKRIQQRNRDGENKVNKELIQSLHDKHEHLFDFENNTRARELFGQQTNVVILDGSQDPVDVLREALQAIGKLDIINV